MSKKKEDLYHCLNKACTLGTIHNPGRFTAGITAHQKHLLTGVPLESVEEEETHGEGFCPNCGEKGEPFDPSREN